MLEESISSLWTSLQNWFTPAVLFLLLNLVIGTIAFTSKSYATDGHSSDHVDASAPPNPPSKLARAPSLVLERLKSIKLYSYYPSERQLQSETLETIAASPVASTEDIHPHMSRSQSDTQPTAGEPPLKLAGKMKKSASEKSAFAHFEGEAVEKVEVVRRSATARAVRERIDECDQVDARADDFINRFRQQLKLQRLDSILRYREMLKRGQ